MTEPPTLTLAEAAAYLKVTPLTVRRHKREIGYVLQHGKLWFSREDLDAYRRRGYVPAQVERPAPVVEICRQLKPGVPVVNVVSGRLRRMP